MMISEYGVKAGDRIAISMRNFPEWIIAFCATTAIGGIAVAMNSLWNPEEMAYGLKDSGPNYYLLTKKESTESSRSRTASKRR